MYCIYSVAQIVLSVPLGARSVGFSAPLATPSMCCHVLFLSTFLSSGATICSELILYISFSGLRIICFSEGPWLLLLKNSIRNQNPDQICSLLLGCHFFYTFSADRTTTTNVYTHTHIYICVCANLYVFVCIFLYV